ncbi:MAG: translational GTPase TypA [Bacilli bacterium]
MKIRNIAIIAHVDHCKTTLVDQLIKKSNTLLEHEMLDERAMDSNSIEKERGITIFSKPTSIKYKDVKINILDTPGHADFGGEVERIMTLVDGVLLLVDAYEATMPQTRFVLKKALEAGLKPIVCINKVDKPNARIDFVLDSVFDLFVELGATDEQLDFKTVYTSALNGTASLSPDIKDQTENFDPIFDLIVKEVEEASTKFDDLFQFQATLMDFNTYIGKIAIGKILSGNVKVGDSLNCIDSSKSVKQFKVTKIFGYFGTKKQELESATTGDMVGIAGYTEVLVSDTFCSVESTNALPALRIDEPTLEMNFKVNNSPFAGTEGKFVTSSKIEERLSLETKRDVSLRVIKQDEETFLVKGRGELHLSIILENMRREGFELAVSKPQAIIKEIDGKKYEPYEELVIEVPTDYVGSIIEVLGRRNGNMDEMINLGDNTKLVYTIPARGLIGFMSIFMSLTHGYGIISHVFKEYRPYTSINVGERSLGVLVSMENGKSTAYASAALEDRGALFIEPGTNVYEGMIIGECNKENDLAVNIIKGKQLTNTRSSGKDNTVVLKKPRVMTLEVCLDYINSDELVEITPENIRLRKIILNTNERKKFDKKTK